MNTILAIIFFLASSILSAQSVLGKWKTIDDETGKAKSVVEIFERDGKLYGKVAKLFREPTEDEYPICGKCTDDRKDQKVIGMEIIRDMVLDDGEYEEGTICDPKNGEVYVCELWLDEDNSDLLQVRGYWGWFFRTQTWQRYTE